MVWQLALFHSMLLSRGITTYEYIVGKWCTHVDVMCVYEGREREIRVYVYV